MSKDGKRQEKGGLAWFVNPTGEPGMQTGLLQVAREKEPFHTGQFPGASW